MSLNAFATVTVIKEWRKIVIVMVLYAYVLKVMRYIYNVDHNKLFSATLHNTQQL